MTAGSEVLSATLSARLANYNSWQVGTGLLWVPDLTRVRVPKITISPTTGGSGVLGTFVPVASVPSGCAP